MKRRNRRTGTNWVGVGRVASNGKKYQEMQDDEIVVAMA